MRALVFAITLLFVSLSIDATSAYEGSGYQGQLQYYSDLRSAKAPDVVFTCTLVTGYEVAANYNASVSETLLEISDFKQEEISSYIYLEKDFSNTKMKSIRAIVNEHVRGRKVIYSAQIYRVQDGNNGGDGANDQAVTYFAVNNNIVHQLDRAYAQTAISEGYNGHNGDNGNNSGNGFNGNNGGNGLNGVNGVYGGTGYNADGDNRKRVQVESEEVQLFDKFMSGMQTRKLRMEEDKKNSLRKAEELTASIKKLGTLSLEQKNFLGKYGSNMVSEKTVSITLPVTSEYQSKGSLNCTIQ